MQQESKLRLDMIASNNTVTRYIL